MTARAQDQLERLLLALPHVAEDTELPLSVLAEQVGTDVETLLRDLQALSTRDRDVAGFVESVELYLGPGHVGARTSHFRRPMRLTRAELAALDLGLGLLLLERPLDERATVQRARRSLREASVAASRRAGVAEAAPSVAVSPPAVAAEAVPDTQAELFGVLREAHEERHAVRIVYQRADAAVGDERVIHPLAIARAHQHIYVVAWCTSVTAFRVFRLDRVSEAVLTDEPFGVPGDFDLESLMRDGKLFSGERPEDELVVRYGPAAARWIAEREKQSLDADGTVTVTWPLADDDWAIRHVLQYGADAQVLAPARIRKLVVERLTQMARDAAERIARS
jgi:proteasome accessory factor C